MDSPLLQLNDAFENRSKLGFRRVRSDENLSQEQPTRKRKLLDVLPIKKPEPSRVLTTKNVYTHGPSTRKGKSFQELNVVTRGLSAIGESSDLTQGWTVFRMLIPISPKDDGAIDRYNRQLKPHFETEKVKVDFHSVAGVGVVVVSAKKDSPTARAANVFAAIHRHFTHGLPSETCVTRLLVPVSHAKRLIILHTIKALRCRLAIYLTDNVSILSCGDVIVEVQGYREDVRETIESVASDLGEFIVDESMVSEFKAGKGIRPPKYDISACRKAYPGFKVERNFEVSYLKLIPLSYIDYIIGKDGANIEKIWKSSSVTVYVETWTLKEVTIYINGDDTLEVEEVVALMENLIPTDQKKDGERAFAGMVASEMTCMYSDDDDEDD